MKDDDYYDPYPDTRSKRFVDDDPKKGIHPNVDYKELRENDPKARKKAREILEKDKGFRILDYEALIVAQAEDIKFREGESAYRAFLDKLGTDYEHRVPDLKFKCKAGWGYLELEVLKYAWDDEGNYKYLDPDDPRYIRYPNRKHHFTRNQGYINPGAKGYLGFWYCQFCSKNMDLHLLFSFEAMRRAVPREAITSRSPDPEVFRRIPEGWFYENGLYLWDYDNMLVDYKFADYKHYKLTVDDGK